MAQDTHSPNQELWQVFVTTLILMADTQQCLSEEKVLLLIQNYLYDAPMCTR